MSSFSNNIFSFCRSGEITVENEKEYDLQLHLSFSDVTVDNAESLKVISVNIKPWQGTVKKMWEILGKIDDDLRMPNLSINGISIKKKEFSGGIISVGQRSQRQSP